MNDLCERIAVEQDPIKYHKLSCELNDLVSATLKSIQSSPKHKSHSAAHLKGGLRPKISSRQVTVNTPSSALASDPLNYALLHG